jgi:hypothetical protein
MMDGTLFLNLFDESTRELEGSGCKSKRSARFILLQHEKSDWVHHVNLPGAQLLWAHDYIVRRRFAGRRVGEFVHVAAEVFKPAR